ncbi:MAG: tetratricopeptide (TPR) repeat protein [Verrucomicrobiales bacterium]
MTMNSPNNGATGKTNWESTLWHEYCHAVTLGATKNRMPRWLTEGLSVYEERLRDPTCGEQMDLTFRHMILEEDELIPLSQLNYGFLRPKSGKHMMFAYYQSSLFVEYFMATFGEEKMRSIIGELKAGVKFSEACKLHAKPFDELEKDFIAYAKDTAKAFGGELAWEVPEENLAAFSLEELAAWVKEHPTNYYGLRAQGAALLRAEAYEDAERVLQELASQFPNHADSGSPFEMLAALYKRTGDQEKEREMLWKLVSQSTDWLDEMLLLLDYEAEAEGWDHVQRLAQQVMAINPYIAKAHKALAESYTATEKNEEAVSTYETLLTLKPQNPAQIHYAVADLLQEAEPTRAKRHVLDALAEAPRYREALRLLRDLRKPE